MGPWAEVHCSCPNRVPVENSDEFFDRPHRRKHRLTKRHQQEVQQWEQSRKNLFQCGHRNGLVIELWPRHIIQIGSLLGTVFTDTPPLQETATLVEAFARTEIERPLEKFMEALTDAARLCRASIETRNPVRLML